MLILYRKRANQNLGDDIEIFVTEVKGDKVHAWEYQLPRI